MSGDIYWLVGRKATVRVTANKQGVITDAAPLVRVFIGQHISNLFRFFDKHFRPYVVECYWRSDGDVCAVRSEPGQAGAAADTEGLEAIRR